MRRFIVPIAAVVAVAAIACGGDDSESSPTEVVAEPTTAPRATPTPRPTATPFPTPPPLPTPAPTAMPRPNVEPLGMLSPAQLEELGLEPRELPELLFSETLEITSDEREALWVEYLSDTRIEFDQSAADIYLCGGGHGTAVRMPRIFELEDQPFRWEIEHSPASVGTEVVLKITPINPDIAANRVFPFVYATPSYTFSADVEEGTTFIRVSVRTVTNDAPPDDTIIFHDANCRSQLPDLVELGLEQVY